MEENVYMHALKSTGTNFNTQVVALNNILRSGALLSLRNQGKDKSTGFNGLDYISLCDYQKRHSIEEYKRIYSAYYSYVRYGITLAFEKNKIEVLTPTFLDNFNYNKKGYDLMEKLGNSSLRFTDLIDEVQAKDKVLLDNLLYLTFPTENYLNDILFLTKEAKYKAILKMINRIDDLLIMHDRYKDIYDIDTGILLNEEGIHKLVYKK